MARSITNAEHHGGTMRGDTTTATYRQSSSNASGVRERATNAPS
jgi:hypothetical protein